MTLGRRRDARQAGAVRKETGYQPPTCFTGSMPDKPTIYSVALNPARTAWLALADTAGAVAEEYQSQDAAFAAARVNARGHRPSLVRVYGRDGSLESTRTYGVDGDDSRS